MPYKLNPLTGGLDYYESGLPSQATHSGKYLTTDGSDASWAALAGGGDMAAATYDPTTVAGDAFDMDNMNDGSTNKVMTATQETNFETAYSHSQAAHGDADADNTASNETSHADVVQDGDFSSNGLMRRTGAGAYDTVTDGTTNWDTAYSHSQDAHGDADADNTASNETSHADVVVDGDFDSDGFLIRSGGAGSYSVDTSTYSASDHNHDADYADIANEHAESHTVASHSDTSATGAELDELTDGSTTSLHSHAGGGGISEYMYPVWAEENAALGASNTYEWAFGNGANTPADGGVVIYVPSGWTAEVVAMSLSVGGGTATVELVHNGTPQGSSARVVLSTGQYATDELGTPLSLSNNDYINFRTSSSSGTSGPCVATAWIKMTET
jgi:hypothetical protein